MTVAVLGSVQRPRVMYAGEAGEWAQMRTIVTARSSLCRYLATRHIEVLRVMTAKHEVTAKHERVLTVRSRMLRTVLRCSLGALMLATGAGKLMDLAGFVAVIETYGLGLSEAQAWTAAVIVTAVELGVGAWLLSTRSLRAAAFTAAALNCAWFALLTTALMRGLRLTNCGCFGVFFARPLRWYSPLEDLVLVAACLLLARLATTSVRNGAQ